MSKAAQNAHICTIGLGYIGLPTSAVLAMHSYQVTGVDVNPEVVQTVNEGKIHIVEPDLDRAVHQVVKSGHLKAQLKPSKADIYIIAVPTPFKGSNHTPDLSYVESAVKAIAPFLSKGNLIVLESTSPVGTTEQMSQWLKGLRPDLKFPSQESDANFDVHLAYCPERVLPGQVLKELIENERIIGGITPACARIASEFYRTFVKGTCHVTNARTAEMVKLTENAFRDVNIAFANELSIICDKQDINVWDLINFANRHPRVKILQPGCGVGGHCIAVDPWFIVSQSPEEARLIRTAREVNDYKSRYVMETVQAKVKDPKQKLALFGLSFKPDIDDLRESPALEIAHGLAEALPNQVLIVEPNIEKLPPQFRGLSNVKLCDLDTGLKEGDVLAFLVAHRHFRSISSNALSGKTVMDFARAVHL